MILVVAAIVALLLVVPLIERLSGESAVPWTRRRFLRLGLTIGVARAVLGLVGWYLVEHTGGAWQLPASLLSILALPEAGL